MIDPVLTTILLKTFGYGMGGSLIAVAARLLKRNAPGPRLDQAAAVGFLIGAGFGAFFAIFQSMMVR
jgi:hypothetical protein